MANTAVVILNYNGRNFLEKFLPSVVKFSENAQIIVADNASTDDSIAFLKAHFPSIKIIQLLAGGVPHNKGFAGGYNDALKQISAKYYVLLNSDVEVTENWILPIITLLENNSTIAACQPKILNYYKKNYFEYAGAAGGFIDYLGYPFCRGRIFDTLEEDLGQYNDNQEIFWATGAAMFVRAKIFHKLGGFDESFFAHMEEIDLCWRIKNAGHQTFYCHESTVFHVGGGTLNKTNSKKTFLNYRNGLAMLYKNLPAKNFIFILFIRLILDGISGIKLFMEGKFSDVLAIIKAHFAFYGMIPELQKKRKIISPKIVSEVYQKSIVWEYFVKKLKLFSDLNWNK